MKLGLGVSSNLPTNHMIPVKTACRLGLDVNYHICREAVAAKIMRHAKEDTETNLADALTKILPIERKEKLLGRFLFKCTKRNATDEHNK